MVKRSSRVKCAELDATREISSTPASIDYTQKAPPTASVASAIGFEEIEVPQEKYGMGKPHRITRRGKFIDN